MRLRTRPLPRPAERHFALTQHVHEPQQRGRQPTPAADLRRRLTATSSELHKLASARET